LQESDRELRLSPRISQAESSPKFLFAPPPV
jgi:hypothetical protein